MKGSSPPDSLRAECVLCKSAAPAVLSIPNPGPKAPSALGSVPNKVSGECPGQAAAPVVLREGHEAQGKASYCWTETAE